jgi:hypothetical protein
MEQLRTVAPDVRTLRGPDLTVQIEKWLTDGLVAALPSLRLSELFATRMDMFREANLITVALDQGKIVGVLSSRWAQLGSGVEFLHITTQFVADGYRHGAVFRRSWGSHFTEMLAAGAEFPRVIALKTYNPVVYCAMRAFTRAPGTVMYPVIGSEHGDQLAAVPAEVAAAVAPGRCFEQATGRIRSTGSPVGLYPVMPLSKDATVNDYFARTLQPGDRILCILSIPSVMGARIILNAFGVTQ